MRYKINAIKCGALFFAVILTVSATAQTSCEVSAQELKGNYSGECKGGKAHGTGKAIGLDMYEGNFKNGYPDGEGWYTFKDGNFYKGSFKKGQRSGAGEFHYLKVNSEDSIIKGYWSKDNYTGEYEKPYNIITKSMGVVRIAVREQRGAASQVRLISKPQTKATITGIVLPQSVTDISIINGNFARSSKIYTDREATTILDDIIFPLRIAIRLGNHLVELELFRPAAWEVEFELGGF
ncbi:MAG: hypothetical protein WKF88_01055 [Ferruginibacter sp.]